MMDLSTTYMGLKLKNPIIVGSSGLTNSVKNIIEIEEKGAGAVVLKSLFEEQINFDIAKTNQDSDYAGMYPEAADYISNYTHEHHVERYLELIRDSKEAVSIPIIASINCVSDKEWIQFAKKIEEAGADALELNVFLLPSDPLKDGIENEEIYFKIIEKVKKVISIPVSIKISYYFSSLTKFSLKLSWSGIDGLVLFNRFFSPDIDIDNFKVTATNVFSTPEEIATSLRWVALLSDKVNCDIAASTGIHDSSAAIKQLLAGAKAVQICTTLYKNGFGQIETIVKELEEWMQKHDFTTTQDFIGKLSYNKAENPAAFERVQFMKHFAGIE
ncbi:MAG: dihydroorotate dehydrogenase-like protein [Bacteroidales bacterium]|nr:dihydroorotate dehydrogenase-like protein [Bacteroidales bacterium]